MTLLELLVKELPKRGGWNINAHGAVQDNSGQVWFYKNGKPEFAGVIWAADNNSNSFDWVQWDLRFKRSEDYNKSIVTREQYEAAIAAQHPVWNGEGLPTTGVKCEWQDCNTKKWITVRVVYSSEWITIISEDKDDDAVELAIENYGDKGRRKFRPLRTEEDRKRDIAVGAMEKSWEGATDKPAHAFESIYDAIAAGKIPGIELSK